MHKLCTLSTPLYWAELMVVLNVLYDSSDLRLILSMGYKIASSNALAHLDEEPILLMWEHQS